MDYCFYPRCRVLIELQMECKPSGCAKCDGSFEHYMFLERWTRHVAQLQVLACDCLPDDFLRFDSRVSDFIKKHWRVLYESHGDDIGARAVSFREVLKELDTEDQDDGSERQISKEDMKTDVKLTEPELTLLFSTDGNRTPALDAILSRLKHYDESKPLLVLRNDSCCVSANLKKRVLETEEEDKKAEKKAKTK